MFDGENNAAGPTFADDANYWHGNVNVFDERSNISAIILKSNERSRTQEKEVSNVSKKEFRTAQFSESSVHFWIPGIRPVRSDAT